MSHVTAEYLAAQGLSESFPRRFFEKFQKTDGCWIWTGNQNSNGYGAIWKGFIPREKLLAPRASWIIHVGCIPEGMCILHHCDNPLCVRPDHLRVGTRSENNDDKMKRGRYRARVNVGEDHPMAILTEQDVESIIHERLTNGTMLKDLAKKHGVCLKQIWRIVNGLSWHQRKGFKVIHAHVDQNTGT